MLAIFAFEIIALISKQLLRGIRSKSFDIIPFIFARKLNGLFNIRENGLIKLRKSSKIIGK